MLIVVDNLEDWPATIPGSELVNARGYLTDPRFTGSEYRAARLVNLSRSYRYQSTGYYVSLLAEARGHKPIPTITTIQDLKIPGLLRDGGEELEELVQRALAPLKSETFTLSVYFGRNLAKRYATLSRRLYQLFPSPLLRAVFARSARTRRWALQRLRPITIGDIPESHWPFVIEVGQDYLAGKLKVGRSRRRSRFDLAILHDPEDAEPPSDPRALRRFVKAAEQEGFAVEFIQRQDFARLAEFDALFIRETTSVHHHTYRFARRAAALGLVTIDDPASIFRCTNKVYVAELLQRHGVSGPRTLIVHRSNAGEVEKALGLPAVLKRPDSSFSRGVVKVETSEELARNVNEMLERSALIIAQEFLPTDFDYRVGIIDRKPLYVCKYFMARSHWQIIRRDGAGTKVSEGAGETLAVEDAPPAVVRCALKAARLIGDGLYGVDVKQAQGKAYVIEINDNPSLDAGVEDGVLGPDLYRRIMQVFLKRVEQTKRAPGEPQLPVNP